MTSLHFETATMRLPRFRFTVRGLMVVVAIVACLSGLVIFELRDAEYRRLRQKSAEYLSNAEYYRDEEMKWKMGPRNWFEEQRQSSHKAVDDLSKELINLGVGKGQAEKFVSAMQLPTPEQEEAMLEQLPADPHPAKAAYFQQLRLKYEHAARNPSLPVEPDPPEPK